MKETFEESVADRPSWYGKRIVVMGGGTGTFTVLSGIKKFPAKISAIVSIADNGGSTGILRDELGVLPPGDIRQCLVALADEQNLWRQVFSHRLKTDGTLNGHTGGNLILSLLEDMMGDPLKGIEAAHKLLKVKGDVIPVSTTPTNLVANLEDGSRVEGEHAVDELAKGLSRSPIKSCVLEPMVSANPNAIEAIKKADLIVMGPGDLYTSLLPVLLVDGIQEALIKTTARLVYVMNLMSKRGQTDGYTAQTFIDKLHKILAPAKFDRVIVNDAPIPSSIVDLYKEDGEYPISTDGLRPSFDSLRLMRQDLISDAIHQPLQGDAIKRSVLRHDSDKLALALLSCLS